MSSQSENGGAQAPVGSAVTSSGAPSAQEAVSYTHLTLPTIYSV